MVGLADIVLADDKVVVVDSGAENTVMAQYSHRPQSGSPSDSARHCAAKSHHVGHSTPRSYHAASDTAAAVPVCTVEADPVGTVGTDPAAPQVGHNTVAVAAAAGPASSEVAAANSGVEIVAVDELASPEVVIPGVVRPDAAFPGVGAADRMADTAPAVLPALGQVAHRRHSADCWGWGVEPTYLIACYGRQNWLLCVVSE